MNRPRAVVFDLGKVLVDFDYGIAARKIAGHGTMDPDAVRKFLDHSPLLYTFETGRMTEQQFFETVRDGTGFRGDFEAFANAFADIFFPIEPMIALHARVRAAGTPTYIFSNTNGIAVSHIRRRFPFFANFDGYILSYEHGAMKPDARLYEVVERQSGLRGEQLLYMDDRPENVAAGAERGWQVILQTSPELSIEAIGKTGLLD
jgi:HAD superfamily hydrolase (TIGR01509 family)